MILRHIAETIESTEYACAKPTGDEIQSLTLSCRSEEAVMYPEESAHTKRGVNFIEISTPANDTEPVAVDLVEDDCSIRLVCAYASPQVRSKSFVIEYSL